ncbi:MAG: hypothetical protein NC089_12645 [Bacteroides sp.]|nr:hypothetical protein [Bacteroides sp.]MCM1548990.1 hypothetical protein [Clostridium sp.]
MKEKYEPDIRGKYRLQSEGKRGESKMKWNWKQWCYAMGLSLCLLLTGCGSAKSDTTDMEETTDTAAEVVVPVGNTDYRRIPETLPEAGIPVVNPGTREHFSFVVNDNTYVFTETDTLWLYSQSIIAKYSTRFMLNVKGHKVAIEEPEAEFLNTWKPSDYMVVYSDDVVNIYRKKDSGAVTENEEMYLTLYDLTYQVSYWQELVNKRMISLNNLYTALAQMGTAIVPADEKETLSDVIAAMRVNPVFEDYKMAYREGISYSGFLICSPASGTANHDDISILMSVEIPEWSTYATLHVEPVPDYQERLEDTGEVFDGNSILVDYVGELKYFILSSDGTCIYLDGMPEGTGSTVKSYTAREAAYIFDIALTK